MEARRKAIFALIAAAVLLNIGFGLANNGFYIPMAPDMEITGERVEGEKAVDIPPLRDGGIYRTMYNMSVEISQDKGMMKSSYRIGGMCSRDIGAGKINKNLEGTYDLHYQVNETEDLTITGRMERSRRTFFGESGLVDREELSTSVVINGPNWLSSSSSMDSRINTGPMIRLENLWRTLLLETSSFNSTSNGSLEADIDLQEMGVSLPDMTVDWSVREIVDTNQGRKAFIEVWTTSWMGGSISMDLLMINGSAWPELVDVEIQGVLNTDEGLERINMRMTEKLTEGSPGSGEELVFGYYKPMGPPHIVEGGEGMVPAEGGETIFKGCPEDALMECLSRGELLNGMIDDHGKEGITFTDISYGRNESLMWTWNVTLAGPREDGISRSVNFIVGVEGGGLVEKERMTLLSERSGTGFRYPDPDRAMITLSENQERIRDSEYSDIFLMKDGLSPNYGLDIVSRGNTCCDPASVIFMNMLGIQKAQTSDLHISTAVHRKDPSRMSILVVDGNHGDVISETEIRGAGVKLLNLYEFDLA